MKHSSFVYAFTVLFTAITITPAVAHGHTCGFQSKSTEVLKEVQHKIEELKIKELKTRSSSATCKQCIIIDTYMTVIQGTTSREDFFVVTQDMLDKQIEVLITSFADTPFTFNIKKAIFVEDEVFSLNWYASGEDTSSPPSGILAKYPREGNFAALNIYFGGMNETGSFTYSPSDGGVPSNPFDAIYNGLFALDYEFGALGYTLVHEVGHWLGLEHVFEKQLENWCDPADPNDFVDDTPQMGVEKSNHCPADADIPLLYDTCPELPGNDPYQNYMDYSGEECQTEFSPGQIERMYYQWSLFRKLEETCSTGNRLFEVEMYPDFFSNDITWQLVSTDGSIKYAFAPYDSEDTPSGLFNNYNYVAYELDILDICIDASKSYIFTIFDSQGDGLSEATNDEGEITMPGYYTIRYDEKELVAKTSDYASSQATPFSGDGAVTATPAPVVAATRAPVVAATPAPVVAETTAPVVAETTAPVIAATPAPVVAETTAPVVAETTAPVVTATPAPVVAATPAPVVAETPAPVVAETTAPVVAETPAPVVAETPAPVVAETTAPVVAETTAPVVTATPAPVVAETPAPVVAETTAPVVAETTAPVVAETPAPVVAATPAPVVAETTAPVVAGTTAPSAPPAIGLCFSGASLVDVQGKGQVPLNEVQIGDKIHVGHNKFEPIYSFGHRDEKKVGDFLKISSSTPEALELSPDHMIYTKLSNGFVPASHLKVGDTIVDGMGQDLVVKSIRATQALGVYAPFTPSGTIVVNNVLASSFVAFEGKVSLEIGWMSVSYQWLAHTFEMPHRMVCYHLGSCPLEQYNEEGISTWVVMPHHAAMWLSEQPDGSLLKSFISILAVSALAFFSAVDAVMTTSPMVLPWSLVAAVYYSYRNSLTLGTEPEPNHARKA